MTADLAPGALVAGFRIESLAGHGAMAEVYRARDEQHDRIVALKVLDKSLEHDERFRQRFLRESQLAASLDHPHIVPTITSGEDDGLLYLAMEFIEGSDLRQLLQREGRLDPERAVGLVEQAADALDAAHAAGLVHRDVKPGNILVHAGSEGEHAYVCDFGLARHAASVSSLTGDRGFVGTIDYVPPEQIEGGRVDARADVYSLGCVLYECLAGVRPFERDSELAVVFAHLNEPPPKLTDVRPELPRAFDEVFATALAKAPDDRYSSCGELATAARAALHGEVLARRRPRRRLIAAAAVVAILVAAAVAAGLLLTGGKPAGPATITPTSIAGARLGDSSIALERLWGPSQRLSMSFPPDYSVLTTRARNVSAYFAGATDKTVEITTWNKADRTAEGIGPCSSAEELKSAYGKRLKPSPNSTHNGVVSAYTVGKHLLFAMGPGTTPKQVETVALFSNALSSAGFNALNDGPCAVGTAAVAAPQTTTGRATSAPPALTQTFVSRHFEPRLTIRAPAGWSVHFDNGHAFALASPDGPPPVGDQIAFFLDPYASAGDGPTHPGGRPLAGVSRTPAGLVAWLRQNRALVVSPPATVKAGHPLLTWRTVDIDLAASAPREDPGCPGPCLSYLAFRGPGYPFSYGTGRGEPARLYFTSVRIGTVVRTLAIAVDSPSRVTFKAILPAAEAIVASLRVAAAAVPPLSALSSFCTAVFNGTCLGELAAGTHSTTTFRPALTYTVPVGWINFSDHRGFVAFVPPGGDWTRTAVDNAKTDYIMVATSIATSREGCADGPSKIRTPTAFARWLQHEPGLTTTRPDPVAVGGLSGVVVDIRMRKDWTKTCPWSHGVPAAQVLWGLAPSPTGFAQGTIPQPMVMRLYLLIFLHGTLGIEIYEVSGDEKLDAYSAVVKTFRFAGR